jgi:hypothetical protein
MDRRLAVQEKKIGVNRTTWGRRRVLGEDSCVRARRRDGVGILRQDEDTVVVGLFRGVIKSSRDGMNLVRWFFCRAHC